MKLQEEPSEQAEKQMMIERLYGKYGFDGIKNLVKYMQDAYPKFPLNEKIKEKVWADEYLDMQDVKEINEAVSKVILFPEVQTILDRSPPGSKRNGGDLFVPFKGYYITVNRKWKITLGNNWDEIKTTLERSLKKNKPNFSGIKTYAILKAFVKNYTDEGVYEVSTVKLVADANNQLNQNPEVRVWYNNFNDLLSAGIVFNTRSNKYGEMTLLPEVMPIVKLILKEYEQGNVKEIDNVKNGKPPFYMPL